MVEGWRQVRPASEFAGVCERTFRSWLKAGCPYSRLESGMILINLRDLEQWLKAFRVRRSVDEIADEVFGLKGVSNEGRV